MHAAGRAWVLPYQHGGTAVCRLATKAHTRHRRRWHQRTMHHQPHDQMCTAMTAAHDQHKSEHRATTVPSQAWSARKNELISNNNDVHSYTHYFCVWVFCQRIRNCGRLQVDWSIGQESWWYIAIKALLVDFAQTYIFFWVHTQNVHVAHYKLYAQPITCTCWPAQLMSYFDAEIPACISPS